MKNFIHLVGEAEGPATAVVDPAWDVAAIDTALAADGRRLVGVFVTHSHHDHINGLEALLERHDVPVWAQRAEVEVSEALRSLGSAVRRLAPGELVMVGALPVTCLHTPGHTPGSQCLQCGGAVFTGDTLFVNACGRCDLPGGDVTAMHRSLHEVLGALPDETVVYPGHDYGDVPVSSIGREKANNPYLQLKDAAAFRAWRMRPR